MWNWALAHPEIIAALASIGLVFFAAVQIGLEVSRRRDAHKAGKVRIRGPAWLARRMCEASLQSATTAKTSKNWAGEAGPSVRLDRLEVLMLEVLHLGAAVGEDEAAAADDAFASFTAYSDRLNRLFALQPSGITAGVRRFTQEDEEQGAVLFKGAIKHLTVLIDHLAELAPRRQNEPELPTLEDVPQLPLLPKSS